MGIKPAKRHFEIEEIKDILSRNVSLYKDQQGFVDFFVELSLALLQQDKEAANQVAPPPRPTPPTPSHHNSAHQQQYLPPQVPQNGNQQYNTSRRMPVGYSQPPVAVSPQTAPPVQSYQQNNPINHPMRQPVQQHPAHPQQQPIPPQLDPAGYQQSPKTHDQWPKLPSSQAPQLGRTSGTIPQGPPSFQQGGQMPSTNRQMNPAPFQKPQAPLPPQMPNNNYTQPTPPIQTQRSSLTPDAYHENVDQRPKTHFEDLKPRGEDDTQRGRPKSHVMGRAKVYRVVRSYKSGSIMDVPCPVCGQKVAMGEKYCPSCGNCMNDG